MWEIGRPNRWMGDQYLVSGLFHRKRWTISGGDPAEAEASGNQHRMRVRSGMSSALAPSAVREP